MDIQSCSSIILNHSANQYHCYIHSANHCYIHSANQHHCYIHSANQYHRYILQLSITPRILSCVVLCIVQIN